MNGNAGTDGYNSALGPCRANAHDSTGNVASIGPMKFNGNVLIQGDATSASTPSRSAATSRVRSRSTRRRSTPWARLACAAGGTRRRRRWGIEVPATTPDQRALGERAGSIVLNGSGPYHFSSISLSGQATLQVNGPAASAWTSRRRSTDFERRRDHQRQAEPDGAGDHRLRPPSKPSGWQSTGNASSYFTIYAPNHDVTLSGNGALYGCIVADDFTASGNAAVHADEALAGACGTSGAGGSGGNTDTPWAAAMAVATAPGGMTGENGNGHGDDGRGNGGDDGSGSHGGHGDR